jgi:CDP-glucose 4,6-dehydratase
VAFDDKLKGLRVLVTGHTGFKGGWLSLWLADLGAEVHGFALEPHTTPNLHDLVALTDHVRSRIGDIRDRERVAEVVNDIKPDVVFHLAAQPLVRRSYRDPLESYATNTMGTAHLLEACRGVDNLRAVLCVTTDKVYENREWPWPYRETDGLGGKDPYSASKAAAELVALSYGRAFFAERNVALLTARGGNVIGGGDWSEDRLVPDLVRAHASGEVLRVRSPNAVRPWQHVLGLCHGYLRLVEAALASEVPGEGAWNFGPTAHDFATVRDLVERCGQAGLRAEVSYGAGDNPAETKFLTLDSSKARSALGWDPRLDLDEALVWTADWYLAAARGEAMIDWTRRQIAEYTARMEAPTP